MSRAKNVNIPLSCLPETLTMERPKREITGQDVLDAVRYRIGVDEAIVGDSTVFDLINTRLLPKQIKEGSVAILSPLNQFDGLNTYFSSMMATCLGTCQPCRPPIARKHVNSTIIEQKQLT